MAKTEPKTKVNSSSVNDFLESVPDEKKRQDCYRLLTMLRQLTGVEPRMWGSSIVGFGLYQYRYDSGHQGEAPTVGFSPRKQNITLYVHLPAGFPEQPERIAKIGKLKTGAGCLYINRLEELNQSALIDLIRESLAELNQRKEARVLS